MNARKHALAIVSGILIIFSACKKDLIAPEEGRLSQVMSSDASADDVPETESPIQTAYSSSINSNTPGFLQAVPARYDLTTKKYPLIVFIHGIGELGSGSAADLHRLTCCGLPREISIKEFPSEFVTSGVRRSFIVVSPQFRVRPSAADVQAVIDYAKKRFRIDESRVYVTGLSMGGGSTWDYSAVYGQNIAAAVPVCGGTQPTTTLAKQVASKNLPVWTISSSGDEVVPIQWAKDWVNWINQYNPANSSQIKLTVWTSENHNATWGRAFNPNTKVDGYNIYEWMLLHTRGGVSAPPPPPPSDGGGSSSGGSGSGQIPVAHAGNDQTIPVEWKYSPLLNATTSSDPDGWITSFTWTKESGPSSYSFSNANSGQTRVNNLVAGTYVFRVTIKDNSGLTSYDDVVINITQNGSVPAGGGSSGSGSSTAPVAKAGADQSIPLAWKYAPLLNATPSTDPDGWIKSFSWSKVSGPSSYSFSNANAGQTRVNNLVAGTYVFRVTVTDNSGAVSTDDVQIRMY